MLAKEMPMGGVGDVVVGQNLQESWSKVSHAARELATIFSLTFFLVTVVDQLVKTPPPPTEGVSAHH